MIYPKYLVLHPPKHTQIETSKIITILKQHQVKSPILEFGAGTGRLTLPLIQAGFKVEVVEPDLKSAQILKEIIPDINVFSQIPNKQYSAIVGTDVLHHLDLNIYLPIFYKHLKPSGFICFSEPNGLNPLWYLQPQVLLCWNLEKGITQITRSNLLFLLNKYCFTHISITGFWFNYRLLISVQK